MLRRIWSNRNSLSDEIRHIQSGIAVDRNSLSLLIEMDNGMASVSGGGMKRWSAEDV